MLKAVVGGSGGGSAAGITIGTSIITGGTDTRVLFDDAGVVGESAGLTYVKATGMLSAGLSGSAAAWTTSGIRLIANAASFTDTSSSGTVAVAYTDLHGASTILASSATTYTRYYGAFFVAPVASTNVTMTNKSALGADSISTAGAAQGTDSLAVGGTARFFGAVTALSSINGTSSAAIAGFGSGTFVGSTPQMTLGVLNTTAGGLRLFGTSGSAVVTLSSSLATSNVAAIGTGSGDASGQLNAAAAALGGATIGSNALAVTGTANISAAVTLGTNLTVLNAIFAQASSGANAISIGSTGAVADIQITSNGRFAWSSSASVATSGGDTFLGRGGAAATVQQGLADVDTNAAIVAQNFRTQGALAGGTSNQAGKDFTITISPGKGTGAGGQYIIKTAPAGASGTSVNAAATGLTITAPAVNMQPSVVLGNQALATTATDGFLYIASGAGPPTGVPTAFTGRVPLYYDSTNDQLYIYQTAWKQPKTPAGAAIVTWQ